MGDVFTSSSDSGSPGPGEPVYPGQKSNEDGSTLDEATGISHRLKWQFAVHDVLHSHEDTRFIWEGRAFVQGNLRRAAEAGRLDKPPPPADPRTKLPDLFHFRGWNLYDRAHFDVHKDHPPCYPLQLVGRLKALHESGVGGREVDDVVYLVVEEARDCEFGRASFGDTGEDVEGAIQTGMTAGDESGSGDEGDEKPGVAYTFQIGKNGDGSGVITEVRICDADDLTKEIRRVGIYKTLEQANDAAMSSFEKARRYREHLVYQAGVRDEVTWRVDPILRLSGILPEDQEQELGVGEWADENEHRQKEGATWRLDDSGCLRLTGYGSTISTFTVTRHAVPQGFSDEQVVSKYFHLLAQGETTIRSIEKIEAYIKKIEAYIKKMEANREIMKMYTEAGQKHLEKAGKYLEKSQTYDKKAVKNMKKVLECNHEALECLKQVAIYSEQANQYADAADAVTPDPSLHGAGEEKAAQATSDNVTEGAPKEHDAGSPSTPKGTKRAREATISNGNGAQHREKTKRRHVMPGFR